MQSTAPARYFRESLQGVNGLQVVGTDRAATVRLAARDRTLQVVRDRGADRFDEVTRRAHAGAADRVFDFAADHEAAALAPAFFAFAMGMNLLFLERVENASERPSKGVRSTVAESPDPLSEPGIR